MATELSAESPNKSLFAPSDCLSIREGRLAIEELLAGELAQRFGTPLYVHSERRLRENARAVVAAFSERWPEGPVLVMPSIKANLSLALRRILTDEGTGCDTFGPGELEAALREGIDPEKISLNGSSKDRALLERAVRAGVRVTVDSLAELEQLREIAHTLGTVAQIRLRTRPELSSEEPTDLAAEPVPISYAVQRYKPGIPTEQLLAIPAETVSDSALELRGLMLHIGRQGRDPALWAEAATWLAATVGEVSDRWNGWRPRELDVGGGFPVPRDPIAGSDGSDRPNAPTIEEYAQAITEALRDGLLRAGVEAQGIQLEVEPGRRLYADTGVHLTKVRNLKRQRKPVPLKWVEVDTSEIFVADVVFERNRWRPVVVDRADEPLTETADIVGISCNSDIIVADAALPRLAADDVIALLDTGAYQDVNASNFNALPRPATVLVNGADAEVIKRADTLADVFARDRIPARLRKGPGGPAVRGLDHVSVSSGDLDRSLVFYSELLGIPVMQRGEAEGPEIGVITGLGDSHVRFADLDLGDGRVLEVLQFVRPSGPPTEAEFHHPGSGHLSLRVSDAEAAHTALVDAGIPVRSEPIELDEPGYWHGARCFYTVDPDGATVEIIERR